MKKNVPIQKEVFSAKMLPETIIKIRKISEVTGLKVHAVLKNAVDEYEKNPKLPVIEPERSPAVTGGGNPA